MSLNDARRQKVTRLAVVVGVVTAQVDSKALSHFDSLTAGVDSVVIRREQQEVLRDHLVEIDLYSWSV
jgi:hypothetical protein